MIFRYSIPSQLAFNAVKFKQDIPTELNKDAEKLDVSKLEVVCALCGSQYIQTLITPAKCKLKHAGKQHQEIDWKETEKRQQLHNLLYVSGPNKLRNQARVGKYDLHIV